MFLMFLMLCVVLVSAVLFAVPVPVHVHGRSLFMAQLHVAMCLAWPVVV
jgi:hypothetical protein